MNDEFGAQVKAMKPKDIRTGLISDNLSIIGDVGELRKRLADSLRSKAVKTAGKASTNSGGKENEKADEKKPAGGFDSAALFEAITSNEGENAFILSLSGKKVNADSGKGDLRKAYLLLSSRVHPDKHSNSKESVEAFQIVLSAYELLCNPPEEGGDQPAGKRKKTERFTRGNEGCHKTKIACPQCKKVWGDAVLGLEDASYNFLMQGVKTYLCGICFCEFGCMTAIHYCPFCRKPFNYDPEDYHRKIVCGNEVCMTHVIY